MSIDVPTGLPAVNQALEPAWVRHGSTATQKTYETALAFEEMLVQQLSQSLTATSGLEGGSSQGGEAGAEESGSSSFGTSQLSSLLPQALSNGVMSAGGLGLAAQLTREMQSAQGVPTQTGGGTPPNAAHGAVSPAGGGVSA
jgi:Rod binding domain-containing protein